MGERKRKAAEDASPSKKQAKDADWKSRFSSDVLSPRRSPRLAAQPAPDGRKCPNIECGSRDHSKRAKRCDQCGTALPGLGSPRAAPSSPKRSPKMSPKKAPASPKRSPKASPKMSPKASPKKGPKLSPEEEAAAAKAEAKKAKKAKKAAELAAGSPEELRVAEAYREKHHITTVEGTTLPNPFVSFDDAPFDEAVLKSLKAAFSEPSPIQAQAWPLALTGVSVLGVSKTGSGKTLAFLLPAVHLALQDRNSGKAPKKGPPQILVLAPTRELAVQIEAEAKKFSTFSSVCLYGGMPKGPQIAEMKKQPSLVVATPGRLMDLHGDKAVTLNTARFVVLDEADRMLDMGFAPQLKEIFAEVPEERQVMCFTATWPKIIQKMALQYMPDAVQIRIGETLNLAANKSVTQTFFQLTDDVKDQKLYEVLQGVDKTARILVFANTKRRCEMLAKMFWSAEYGTCAIHGDKTQWEREEGLKKFKKGDAPVMFATDVAARGLDIGHISHVVNYDMSADLENYVHRIGRTGRAGKSGTSVTFVNSDYDMKCCPALVKLAVDAAQPIPAWLQKYADKQKALGPQKKKDGWAT